MKGTWTINCKLGIFDIHSEIRQQFGKKIDSEDKEYLNFFVLKLLLCLKVFIFLKIWRKMT